MSDDGKCEGGWVITSEPCPKCGATADDECGVAAGTTYFKTEPTELDRLRETQAVLVDALREARSELEFYELENTGEHYNNLQINAALTRAESGQ